MFLCLIGFGRIYLIPGFFIYGGGFALVAIILEGGLWKIILYLFV